MKKTALLLISSLALALASPPACHAQTIAAPAHVNPNTGALLAPTADAFKTANSIQPASAVLSNLAGNTGTVNLGSVTLTLPSSFATATNTLTFTNKTISGSSNTLTNIGNGSLTNSAITIAGASTALGSSITRDTLTGLSSNGLVKRTAANTLDTAAAGTDYQAPLPSTSGHSGHFLKFNGTALEWAASGGGGSDPLYLQSGAISLGDDTGTAAFLDAEGNLSTVGAISASTGTITGQTFIGAGGAISLGDATGTMASIDADGTIRAVGFSGAGDALTALNATQLTSGTIPDARFPATLPASSGENLTSLTAANITAAGTLPALNGAALTALNATQLTSGTIPDARFPATLPAVSGENLTALNATELTSGTIPHARFPAMLKDTSGTNAVGLDSRHLYNTFGSTLALDWNPQVANAFSALYWIDSGNGNRLTGSGAGLTDITVAQVQAASSITPVADGTYTVGLGGAQNGTITTVKGIITAVQEAMP